LILLEWCAIEKSTKVFVVAIFILIATVLFFPFANGRAFEQEERISSAWATPILEPFWTSSRMTGETVMFVQRPEQQVVTARLLFAPARILKVTKWHYHPNDFGHRIYAQVVLQLLQ
jgi:hypothetical protein